MPGAGLVGRAAEGTLDRIGAVSPRGRRIAVYTGAGVLGVAGVVEWPVAITGAAVAWLTQPRGDKAEEHNPGTNSDATRSGGSDDAHGEAPTPRVMPAHAPPHAPSPSKSSARETRETREAREAQEVEQAEQAQHTASPPPTPSGKLPTHTHTNG
ncbi:hypothetical protein SNL152K_6912 [Streptomyces sp. NL15-2K]|nr:hypothetical protein SNL152K_6912 [Streptomyces sp. NL15-2K]